MANHNHFSPETEPTQKPLSEYLERPFTEVFPGVLFSDGSREEVVINGRRVSLVTPEEYEHYDEAFGDVTPRAKKEPDFSNDRVVAASLPEQSISLGRSLASNPEYYGINKKAFYIAGQVTALLATIEGKIPSTETNVYDFVVVRDQQKATLAPHTRFNDADDNGNVVDFIESFNDSIGHRVSNSVLRRICQDAFKVGLEEWAAH